MIHSIFVIIPKHTGKTMTLQVNIMGWSRPRPTSLANQVKYGTDANIYKKNKTKNNEVSTISIFYITVVVLCVC